MPRTHDRLKFNSTLLPNGVRLHCKQWDVPFVDIRILVPFGHAHCTGSILPGSAHVLEHCATHRSGEFPEDHGFDKYVAQRGGGTHATTSLFSTLYQAAIPSTDWQKGLMGLLSSVFDPIITDEIVQEEIRTIEVESGKIGPWYPAHNELAQYLATQWMHALPVTKRQRYGNGEDRAGMSVNTMKDTHTRYFRDGVHIFLGGTFEEERAIRAVGGLPNMQHIATPDEFSDIRWLAREYHERDFKDVGQYVYFLSGICDSQLSSLERRFLELAGLRLAEFPDGALYQWLRKKKQWVYSVNLDYENHPKLRGTWGLEIAFARKEHVEEVRSQLSERLRTALLDDAMMDRCIAKISAADAFRYQRIGDVLRSAEYSILQDGTISTEESIDSEMNMLNDPGLRLALYEKLWREASIGEFLATPAT